MDIKDLYWLAGLLEGEGCFGLQDCTPSRKSKRIIIQIAMTDEEPIRRAARIMNTNVRLLNQKTKGGKNIWQTYIANNGKAASWMMTLYSLMSPRRKNKIEECLSAWKTFPGRGRNLDFTRNIGKISNITGKV